ncbi:hypothetical protein D1872_318300 [compost metagenome]
MASNKRYGRKPTSNEITTIAPIDHSHGHRLAGGSAAGRTGLSSSISTFSNSSPIIPPVTADSASTISHWPTISLRSCALPAPNVLRIATRS